MVVAEIIAAVAGDRRNASNSLKRAENIRRHNQLSVLMNRKVLRTILRAEMREQPQKQVLSREGRVREMMKG